MDTTTNLGLSKPDYDNVADITVLDDNFDVIDAQFDGTHLVTQVNGVTPTNGAVTVDLGVTSVNGETGDVTVTQRSIKELIDIFYPVGSYYETTDTGFNPNVSWGGTWEKIVDGAVLIAGGGSYTVGSSYGSATHQLTINELPSHNHGTSISTETSSHNHTFSGTTSYNGNHCHGSAGRNSVSGSYGVYDAGTNHVGMSGTDNDNNVWNTSTNGNHNHTYSGTTDTTVLKHTHTVTIGNTGNNIGFSVMQPSIAVARWHRTA